MITITVPGLELYNEETNKFSQAPSETVTMEYSLMSIAKWESKWHVPFLGKGEKTREMTIDFFRCMTIGTPKDPNVYSHFTSDNIKEISEYINNPMTAAKFYDNNQDKSHVRQTITAELMYFKMFSYGIPIDCEKWHFMRLMALIREFDRRNAPPKKMGKQEIAAQHRSLNAQRRKAMHTKG